MTEPCNRALSSDSGVKSIQQACMSWHDGALGHSLLPEAWVNRWAHFVVGIEIKPAMLLDLLLWAVVPP